ncbi:MAG: phenylacetate--CoA ligase family protein [Candidatus Omnitrophica bacterium]|nr:phenylacetate--CoA ligase family protein [Candidatus Omnitrophota bacterium]
MYKLFYQKLLNPFFENILKKRQMLKYKAFLEESQWWPREKLLEYQWNELTKLLHHCHYNVPYWKEKFDQLNISWTDIKSYEDFLKLPITTKDDIRKHKERMLARNYIGKTWSKHTGGSTGEPMELDYTPESYDWRVAISKRGYAWTGCEDGMKQFYLWGVPLKKQSAIKRLKENIYYRIHRQRYFNCYEFDHKAKQRCLKTLNAYKPEIIVGYTNPLYALAKFISEEGRLNYQPKAVISAAEKLHPIQREKIKSVFNCDVFDTYGCREFMLIAAEDKEHDGMYLSMENLYVEIIKDNGQPAQPGEKGHLIITDLHNYGMPFIRYRIGDMALAMEQTPAKSGRGLLKIADVVGRSLDMITTKEGKEIPGEFFIRVMRDKRGIDKFRVIQEKEEELIVEMIKNSYFDNKQFHEIKETIGRMVGPSMQVDYQFVNQLPLTQTGKFRVTVSKIQRG